MADLRLKSISIMLTPDVAGGPESCRCALTWKHTGDLVTRNPASEAHEFTCAILCDYTAAVTYVRIKLWCPSIMQLIKLSILIRVNAAAIMQLRLILKKKEKSES